MNLIECLLTQSKCYKGTTKGTPVGVLWHDTAARNPNLWRYVQPSDNDPNKAQLLALIGQNPYGTDWNHNQVDAGVNAFIGKLKNGSVATVQALPWNYRPWGCGSGSKGSCNGNAKTPNSPFWIQFEICDDAYDSNARDYTRGTASYFHAVYKEAVEFTAFICNLFNLNPFGTYRYKGVDIPVITCHKEAHTLGCASGHSDVLQWFSKYGIGMWDIRNAVKERLEEIRDMTLEETSERIGRPIIPVGRRGDELLDALMEIR